VTSSSNTPRRFFYDGSVAQLVERLAGASRRLEQGTLWGDMPDLGAQAVRRFAWDHAASILDEAMAKL
jgi:hypothetical protein